MSLFVTVIVALGLCGCAAGFGGGVVDPLSNEAVEPHSPLLFVYDGERGTVEGIEWPDYGVTPISFGDVVVQVITPDGWTVDQDINSIVMTNSELRAMIVIFGSQYPELELLREATGARAEGVEVSDVIIGRDARVTTHFEFTLQSGRQGAMYGLYTDYRDPGSGIIVLGNWPPELTAQLQPQMERIVTNIVLNFTSDESEDDSCVP
jgi:hypothetical protein